MPSLSRPAACMSCRGLKRKCDKRKPVCGSCQTRAQRSDCAYSDKPAGLSNKAPKKIISPSESRRHKMEPYMRSNAPPQLAALSACGASKAMPCVSQLPRLIPHSSTSPGLQGSASISPSARPSDTPPFAGSESESSGPFGSFDSRGSMAGPTSTVSSLNDNYPLNGDRLIQNFIPHASEFGFFLHTKRFMRSVVRAVLPGDVARTFPSQALMNTVYMWGAHLSGDPREEHFRFQALQSAGTDLQFAGTDQQLTHPESFLHAVQVEVLLSVYFFKTGHFLVARAHAATAVALVLGGGLHRIRSVRGPDLPVLGFTGTGGLAVRLREPADEVEEGERINAFWAVFVLQSNFSVALEPAAHVYDIGNMQIDTPWPLEMEDYEQGLLSDVQGDSTVQNYLSRSGVSSYQEHPSINTLNVRACILLHRAVYLHGQWTLTSSHEAQTLSTEFDTVDFLIDELRTQLSEAAGLSGRNSARTMLLVRSMLNAATIKLHSVSMFSPTRPMSRGNCLAAAMDMFRFGEARLQDLGHLNPVLGMLWVAACSVLIMELLQDSEDVWSVHPLPDQIEIYAGLQDGLSALSIFARESLLMQRQLAVVQEAPGAV